MKRNHIYAFIFIIGLIIIDTIGQKSIYVYILRLYNGTEVHTKYYSVTFPENWAIQGHYNNQRSTRIVGHLTDGSNTNIFMIDLYEYGFVRKSLLLKLTQCDHKTWYPLETNEGKKVALSLCTFDFNNTNEQKPSLTLVDGNATIIAAAHDWKPYYHNEYLKIFKSIHTKKESHIIDLPKQF